MGEQLKVLVSAYSCEPGKGSEPGVGWHWVRQIARFHEVWVITRANNRSAIEQMVEQQPMPTVHWLYFDLPHWASFWKKGQRGLYPYYILWQFGVYLYSKRIHKEVAFDLVHHVTLGAHWLPSFLALLPIPFIWGPVGGAELTPQAFQKTFNTRGKRYERIRMMWGWLAEHSFMGRLNARRAIIALSKAPETAKKLQEMGARHVECHPESGLTIQEFLDLGHLQIRTAMPFRLVSVGRLLNWKGFHLGLCAFAKFCQLFPDSEYWIIGDGSERVWLEQLMHEYNIADKVHFKGFLPRPQTLEALADCDVLIHPSLHDSGGWVCIEAMAAGIPVICLDLGGPALQVTPETGMKIAANSPEQAVEDIALAMLQLAQNPTLRVQMAKAARKRVFDHFVWDKKGIAVAELYARALTSHKNLALDPS